MKLRKVKYKLDYDSKDYLYEGYFHKWVEKINGKYGELPEALIENNDGKIISIKYYDVQFLDKPEV